MNHLALVYSCLRSNLPLSRSSSKYLKQIVVALLPFISGLDCVARSVDEGTVSSLGNSLIGILVGFDAAADSRTAFYL